MGRKGGQRRNGVDQGENEIVHEPNSGVAMGTRSQKSDFPQGPKPQNMKKPQTLAGMTAFKTRKTLQWVYNNEQSTECQ
jgi:hypothetical protein